MEGPHCRNKLKLVVTENFDVRLDAGQGPIVPLKAARLVDPKHSGPIGQHGQFGIFGWSYA